jgi:hypothetical protein
MKNEDKIVELLSESLKRQDQMVERLGNLEKGFTNLEKGFNKLEKRQKDDNDRIVSAVNTLTDIMKAWMEKTKDMENLRARLDRIEKHIGL